jgi:hypothetical protein
MLQLMQYKTSVQNSWPLRGVFSDSERLDFVGINASLLPLHLFISSRHVTFTTLGFNHTSLLKITPKYFAECFCIIFISEVHKAAYQFTVGSEKYNINCILPWYFIRSVRYHYFLLNFRIWFTKYTGK